MWPFPCNSLSVSTYTEQSSFPVGIYLQKQCILVFASLPTLLVVMEWPSFLRLQNQGSTTFNCVRRTSCLECLPLQSKDFQGCSVQSAVLHGGRSWFAARLSLVQLWTFIPTWALFCFLCNSDILGPPWAGFIFLNRWSSGGVGFFSLTLDVATSISEKQLAGLGGDTLALLSFTCPNLRCSRQN